LPFIEDSMHHTNSVCHLLSALCVGGAERFVIDLSLEQIKMGLNVTILSFGSESDDLLQVAIKAGITVKLIKKRWCSNNLKTLLFLRQFNVIQMHSPVILKATLLLLPALINTKVIYTRHGEGRYNNSVWKITHVLAKPFITAITFVSANGQVLFGLDHDWKNLPQYVIENGISVCAEEPLDNSSKNNSLLTQNAAHTSEKKPLKIGSVGRMVSLKAQQHLIQAWSKLPNDIKPKIEIHLIGDGDCREALTEQVFSAKGTSTITFHGFLSERETILNLYDVLVVSSESEGLSIAILEAMANAKPVIATNVGGNPQLVKNNVTGFLYEFGDIAQLTQAIEAYYFDRKKLKQHGLNAQQHIVQNYSLHKTAQHYALLYQQ